MKLTVDILEDFVASLDLSGPIISFSVAGSTTILDVEKTYHARQNMQLDVDGTNYLIVSVVNNTSITVSGVLVSADVYTVPNPGYRHGTPLMTNAHISNADSQEVFPMIYLHELLKEKDKRTNSAIRRESDIKLFFLATANFEDWRTDDHYAQVLLGMNNLVDAFIEALKQDTCQFYVYETDFTRINRVNWGRYMKEKGGEVKRIFNFNLSGVELSFVLPLKSCE